MYLKNLNKKDLCYRLTDMKINKNMRLFITFFTVLIHTISLWAQTIAEKKASFSQSSSTDLTQDMQKYLSDVNQELNEYQRRLQVLYAEVDQLYEDNAPEEAYYYL